ncbi:hypothetical protein EZV62_007336 [Acer yangbiense]|uniref:NB-ARC domain-containing protein n=1 Tax=Acer yangbiense TaxID=1000413 RepID=A0A5C7IAG0_9ROSI|nr:hypothetical protein EZV62_007336 [Acer yangbiense]
MAQESVKNQRDGSSNGRDEKDKSNIRSTLYSQFEDLLEENKKSSVEKLLLKGLNQLIKFYHNSECYQGSTSSNKIEGELQNNERSSSNDREFFRERSQSSKGSSTVYGFENEVLSLERMLLKSGSVDQFKAIAVVGMAGVGKTTLCQEVFNKEEVKRHFVPRIWVCMSRQPNDDENFKAVIVKRMLECLGVDDEVINSIPKDHELSGLVYALHLELMTKKYLIVLEDCEETDEWYEKLYNSSSNGEKWGEQLCHGFPKGYGGAVIVTSRNEEVAKKMVGEENLLQLQPLSDPESCWSIYKDSVVAEGVEFISQEQLKEKLKSKCGGLPLAAKLMGKIKADQQGNAAAQAQDASHQEY